MHKIFTERKFVHTGIGDPVNLRRFENPERQNESKNEVGGRGKTDNCTNIPKYFV